MKVYGINVFCIAHLLLKRACFVHSVKCWQLWTSFVEYWWLWIKRLYIRVLCLVLVELVEWLTLIICVNTKRSAGFLNVKRLTKRLVNRPGWKQTTNLYNTHTFKNESIHAIDSHNIIRIFTHLLLWYDSLLFLLLYLDHIRLYKILSYRSHTRSIFTLGAFYIFLALYHRQYIC